MIADAEPTAALYVARGGRANGRSCRCMSSAQNTAPPVFRRFRACLALVSAGTTHKGESGKSLLVPTCSQQVPATEK